MNKMKAGLAALAVLCGTLLVAPTAAGDNASTTTTQMRAPVQRIVRHVPRQRDTGPFLHKTNLWYSFNFRPHSLPYQQWFKLHSLVATYDYDGGHYNCIIGAFTKVRVDLHVWSNATGQNFHARMYEPCEGDTVGGDVMGLTHLPRIKFKDKVGPKFSIIITEEMRWAHPDHRYTIVRGSLVAR